MLKYLLYFLWTVKKLATSKKRIIVTTSSAQQLQRPLNEATGRVLPPYRIHRASSTHLDAANDEALDAELLRNLRSAASP
uniref:Helicase ATP-binding domain-containing protein n=1 Tax=Steinernema glaseri TaxID=37863 RepID=A0A1I7ZMZ6_9BILA